MIDHIPHRKDDTETEEIQSVQQQLHYTRATLEEQITTGANWFFVISALSVINSLIILTGSKYGYVVGLGFNIIIDRFASPRGTGGRVAGFLLSLIVAGLLALFGIMARKQKQAGFAAGIAIYIIDTVIVVALMMLVDFYLVFLALIHITLLFFIFKGMKALTAYRQIVRKGFFN